MADIEIHTYDIGTVLRFTITEDGEPLDVSTATVLELILAKKDKTFFTRDLVHYTDGTDGIEDYVTVEDDIDMKGDWKAQIYIEMGGGKWHTSIVEFSVEANLDDA